VWSATLNKHTTVAMKILKDERNENKLVEILKEAEIMEKVRHPKLMHFYGFSQDENKRTMISDIALGGDLDKLLHSENKPKILNTIDRIEIIKDVALGIQGFHSKNFVHRDIKPGNILFIDKITEDSKILTAKLADYGAAYNLKSEQHKYIMESDDEFECMSDHQGTVKYAPPEILIGDLKQLTTKADIYSFGILIWEVFTNKRPYDKIKKSVLINLSQKIMNENLTPLEEKLNSGEVIKIPYLPETPVEIEKIVKKCLSANPNDRPSIDEIIDEINLIQKINNLNYINR